MIILIGRHCGDQTSQESKTMEHHSVAKLAEIYNALVTVFGVERPTIKKFADRATGLKRTAALLAEVQVSHPLVTITENGDIEDLTPVSGAASKEATPVAPKLGRGRTADYSDDQRIVILIEGNPKRRESLSAKRWEQLRASKTVGDYLSKVGRRVGLADLHWDADRELIRVEAPDASVA
jgi:hypothetical protein